MAGDIESAAIASELTGSWLRDRRWLLVAPALLFLWIVAQIDKTNVSLIIADPAFLKELNVGGHNTELGGLMSSFFVGYGISIFMWGFLVDRFGPRKCVIAGTLVWALLLFLSSLVGDIQEYLLIRFLLGAAEGNLWPVSNALTNRWFPVREHSRVQSFWITGSTLGTAVGVPIIAALILASGWRGALAALSLVSLLPLALFCFVKDRPRGQRPTKLDESRNMKRDIQTAQVATPLSLQQLLRSRPFWLITVCQFASATTIYTLVQWIPSYVTGFRHLSFKSMGGWITLGYLIAALLTLIVGYIADRTMQRSLAGAWVSVAFVILILPAQIASPIASAVTLAALIGVASSTAALNGALMQTLVKPEAIARGTGIYAGIGMFSSAIGPALFGALIGYLGGRYWGGFLFLALLNAVGAAGYFALHRVSTTNLLESARLGREIERSYVAAR
jgi:sugar phosphate permease